MTGEIHTTCGDNCDNTYNSGENLEINKNSSENNKNMKNQQKLRKIVRFNDNMNHINNICTAI